jgi:hypothetical protein
MIIYQVLKPSQQLKPAGATGGATLAPGRNLLKVNALKNFETTSLRSFSASHSNYDTASIKSDMCNFTDLGALDFTLDDDLGPDDLISDPNNKTARGGGGGGAGATNNVMENFLILDRLNKKQQQRREQLRIKRQQQKLDELRQRQHELEIKALQQHATHLNSASSVAINQNFNNNNNNNNPTTGGPSFRYGAPQQQQQQQHQQQQFNQYQQHSMINLNQQQQMTGNATAIPFQLKYHYQVPATQQLVQFNVSNPSSKFHLIQSNHNLNNSNNSNPSGRLYEMQTPAAGFNYGPGHLSPPPGVVVGGAVHGSFLDLNSNNGQQQQHYQPPIPSVNNLAKYYVRN